MKRPAFQGYVSRRSFLRYSAAGAAGLGMIRELPVLGPQEGSPRKTKVIDCHAHLHHRSRPAWEEDNRKLIEAADRLGIDQLCCSTLTPRRPATAEGFRQCNEWTAEGAKRFPGRVLGYCYVNPGYGREALDEIRRCVLDRGFVGIKLYNEYRCTEPVVFPIVELAIELDVPILHHAGHAHRPFEDQPRISDGSHLAELASRYPEAKLICAHACGGGDWEWTIKALRQARTVHLDLSGSVTDEGVVEMAARVLGPDRLLFGTDGSMTAGIGRMRAADLGAEDREKVLGRNMERLLRRRK